ncbi:MAG: formamidopyrimidine-DNA glycosylase [Desulfotalea sp.]|nr:MAG: formamidopyrimidine-DNA glycosylase [Desulfotalea sp.]
MPELPEIEVICQGLRPLLVDQMITQIAYNNKPLRNPVDIEKIRKEIVFKRITSIERRAKYILILMDNGATLVIHLGMTGNLGVFPQESPLAKHDHVQWTLNNGNQFRYNDIRRFGSIHILSAAETEVREDTFFKTSGPEPFGTQFTANYLLKLATNKKVTVKQFIMDSKVVVGIGNIYANESLFRAGIQPDKPVKDLSKPQWQALVQTIKKVLRHAIECGGSTISNFLNASQERGYFQMNFKVYGKAGQPCPQCKTPLSKSKIAGRATFYCNKCQR